MNPVHAGGGARWRSLRRLVAGWLVGWLVRILHGTGYGRLMHACKHMQARPRGLKFTTAYVRV